MRIRQRTLQGQGFSQQRVTRMVKDGTRIEVDLSTWPIRAPDGSVSPLVGKLAETGAEQMRLLQALANKQLEEVERLYATAPHRTLLPRY